MTETTVHGTPSSSSSPNLVAIHGQIMESIFSLQRARRAWLRPSRPWSLYSAATKPTLWRTLSNQLKTTSLLSDMPADVRSTIESVYGPAPEGDDIGTRALRSRNPTRTIANHFSAQTTLTGAELTLLEEVHAHYAGHTTTLANIGKVTGLLGLIAFAGKLVPEEVFKVLHWGWYGWYQLVVSASAIYVVVAIGAAWLVISRPVAERKRASALFDAVLLQMKLQNDIEVI